LDRESLKIKDEKKEDKNKFLIYKISQKPFWILLIASLAYLILFILMTILIIRQQKSVAHVVLNNEFRKESSSIHFPNDEGTVNSNKLEKLTE
jgi:hypothetical protein